jgi:5-methyltetrahydropteroyltriglutamate--homocysteine methyltransferase
LLRPASLLQARVQHQRNEISREELRRIEDAAIRDAVRMQEDLGLQAVTDGEFRRALWHVDFLKGFENVAVTRGEVSVRFHSEEGETERQPSALSVVGTLSRRHGIFVEDFKFLQEAARALPKVTIPSPSILHFRGGRRAIDRTAYPDMAMFYADLARVYNEEVRDLAAAGCRYLQIDEVDFAFLCDPRLRDDVRRMGEDPDELPHTYAKLINDSIATRPKEMAVCMHLCRGNYRSSWVAEGGYDPVADVLFNSIHVDGYFLEYDSWRAGTFEPLRFVPKDKIVVLGLVTTKQGKLEDKDELKRRIDEAARHLPLDQLAISPQCGFASGAEGNKLTVDDEVAKLRLVTEVAREVWG